MRPRRCNVLTTQRVTARLITMNILEVPFFLNVFRKSLLPSQGIVKEFLNAFKTNTPASRMITNLGRSLCFYNMGMAAIMGG
jgi:hypothetical protein